MNSEESKNEALRLPLWKGVLEELIETAEHGKIIEAIWFEDKLRCTRDSMEFSFALSNIRKGLEHLGMHLSGYGFKGERFGILLPQDNAAVVRNYSAAAIRLLKRSVVLGTTTPLEGLTDSQRRIHEHMTRTAAHRLALMRMPTKPLNVTEKEEDHE